MSYIFISYYENLEKGFKKEFFNQSLIEQFKLIQKRIPIHKQSSSFENFIERCFPTSMIKKYYISCPNFLREKHLSGDGKPTYLNNVVIRPELTYDTINALPDNQNIILIGDIYEGGKLKKFVVKGIQLIDASMSSSNDMVVNASVCNSFERNVWSINDVDYNDTFFTPDKVAELIETCYTVKNPEKIRKTYEEWNKYINFRNYYLEEQSKRNFKLNSAKFINAYAINKKEYKKNSTIYDDYLLDGLKEFSSGDMVCLNTKIEDAEEFPLIRLDIDRNKKIFNAAKIYRCGKLINEEERKIKSLSSDNVFITSKDPNLNYLDNRGNPKINIIGDLLSSGYVLGDRFKIVSYDILPVEHLEQLESDYKNNIDISYKHIDQLYEKKIDNEVSLFVKDFEQKLKEEKIIKLDHKQSEFYSLYLSNDVLYKKKEEVKSKIINSTTKNKNESDFDYDSRIKGLIDKAYIELHDKAYIEFNNELDQFKKELNTKYNNDVSKYKKNKLSELSNKYIDDIRNEKIKEKEKLTLKLKDDKDRVIDEETTIRFSLYFRLNDTNNSLNAKQIKTIQECEYIVYDNRAEKAKINRQEQALEYFYSGYVKNPYLSTYLFDPKELNSTSVDTYDFMYYLDSLNEKQKEAVRKAVSSNGLFLLQGPPGTGKTQVIAEIVAQLVKKGKKVLISSETHKAIDNVFERLPKIAEIVPVRLIPSNNTKKDNDYDPKFLVDNFYKNISTNMNKSINRFRNFEQNKEEFLETYSKLELLKSKIDKTKSVLEKTKIEIRLLEDKAKEHNLLIASLNDEKDTIKMSLDILRRTKRYIDNDHLKPDLDVKREIILSYRDELEKLFEKEIYCCNDLEDLVKSINSVKISDIQQELSLIDPKSNKVLLEIKINELKNELNKYVDDIGDLIDVSYEDIVNEIKSKIRQTKNEINDKKDNSINIDLKLNGIFNYSYLIENIPLIVDLIQNKKDILLEYKSKYLQIINEEIIEYENKELSIENKIKYQKDERKYIENDIFEIQENTEIKEIQKNEFILQNEIIKFFKNFEISESYKDNDDALEIIKRKWNELENQYALKENENKEKIPMYEKISNYISSNDVIEADRKIFTKDLFENANVFGITCTSNNKFSGKNVDALSEYSIDEFDIKSVGIDVVIIDEVSKSSFIDLLIPILYGKTIILVGDHRQLPPMYEFSKLRDEDFDGLNYDIINPEINKKFTNLYEECFFKTLFEEIPDSFKTMLVQQYRCHEHIMNVFNHFYQKELKLGFVGQNNKKKHNIKLLSNGRYIIEPDKHIYFVDCKQNETHEAYSTSMYNTGEAKVVVELIRKLNDYFKKNPEIEKLSIGVICTYGDQARKIKNLLRSEKVKTDAFKTDVEKMIVSTVDDFQGDERDIIILSTVRNPEDPKRSNPGFILAYQRINVALSRARRMLVMIGNRNYLESKGVIELPDVYGRQGMEKRNFRVYEEIISTIERYGKIIADVEVLEDKEVSIDG